MTTFKRVVPENTARNLLVSLGFGQFNATQVIPWLFTQPATSDPKQPAVMMLVGKLQQQLNLCGAGIAESSYLDLPTASALTTIVGDRWETMPWADTIAAVLSAVRNGVQIGHNSGVGLGATYERRAGSLGAFGLPDVPGGIVTYGVAAFFLYRYLKKRKGA